MMNIFYDKNLINEAKQKKLKNIQAFSSLDRTGLSYNNIQRRLFIKQFETGEKLYIQYPGIETLQTKNPKPWDFRPKIQKTNGEWLADLKFKDIWDDLYNFKNDNVDMSNVAILFFRMAFMMDSTEVTKKLSYEDVDTNGNSIFKGEITLNWFDYNINPKIIEDLNIPTSLTRNISLLAYLNCNDYLAQNEDCKYYYRSTNENNGKWNFKTGRTNTLLTHMSVVSFIEKHISFTEIMDLFQRGRGVAPLPQKYWTKTTNGIIKK